MSLLKFTYNADGKKINGYLKSAGTFFVVQEKIDASLFQQHQESRIDVRFYWIDEDGDEIDIISQGDYEIFLEKCAERLHLQVAPKNVVSQEKAAESKTKDSTDAAPKAQAVPPPTADVNNEATNAIHLNVECDSCLMAPIVGFRYKCIQCPNFDLCQNCEAKHVHADHMMVRMPNNNCPYVVDAWVSGGCGRKLGRKFEKRCKSGDATGRPAYMFGVDADKSKEGEQSDRPHGRKHARRHARNTFFSHFYNIMHDLAEGGGAATEAPTSNGGESGTTENVEAIAEAAAKASATAAAKASAAAAFVAAQNAHEAAVKSAEVAHKVAHQAGLSAAASTSAATNSEEVTKEKSNEKANATTSPHTPPRASISGSPSLQDFVQLLDPNLLRSGMDILNNFNDMFAKMLDPMDGAEGGDSAPSSCPFASNARKNSTVSMQSTNSKKSNDSMNSNKSNESKTSNNSISLDKTAEIKEAEQKTQNLVSSLLDISDVGSDSESDSVADSFIKLNAPSKETTPAPATSTPAPSQSSTPPKSLDKSNVMDFAQLSADLKAHIAQENIQKPQTPTATDPEAGHVEMRAVPVFMSPTAAEPEPLPAAQPKKPEEKRAVPIYHADPRINQSVHAMMSMGFSNEGAWLTQLLESVNGNIPEALDLISATQRNSR